MAKGNTKDINETKKKMGRPTKYAEKVVRQFESAFQAGVTDETACSWVGVSAQTYYNWMDRYPDFLERVTKAKNFLRIASGDVVRKDIVREGNVSTAKWWLEKKHPDEFHPGGNINVAVDARQVHVTLPERNA